MPPTTDVKIYDVKWGFIAFHIIHYNTGNEGMGPTFRMWAGNDFNFIANEKTLIPSTLFQAVEEYFTNLESIVNPEELIDIFEGFTKDRIVELFCHTICIKDAQAVGALWFGDYGCIHMFADGEE